MQHHVYDWDRHARNYITCLGKTQAIPLSPPPPNAFFFFFFFFFLACCQVFLLLLLTIF